MLYTGHGDAGYTSVIGGPALLKCHARLEALGAIDEAQAQLGLARALLANSPWIAAIQRVQDDLRLLMAEVALASHEQAVVHYLTPEHLAGLETDLASWDKLTGGFAGFTTPGNSLSGAHLHLARTVIRRAERQVVALAQDGAGDSTLVLTYLNRLSSWAYALALVVEMPIDDIVTHIAA